VERERLQNANNQLHHKLADYFRKKRTDDQHQPLFDKSSQEQEQRYHKYLCKDFLKFHRERLYRGHKLSLYGLQPGMGLFRTGIKLVT
jgi:hypothetical protein